jgi:hypothetical protein
MGIWQTSFLDFSRYYSKGRRSDYSKELEVESDLVVPIASTAIQG